MNIHCFKAQICKLFTLNKLPYGMAGLSFGIWIMPSYNVEIIFLMFFYLMFSISRVAGNDCPKQCTWYSKRVSAAKPFHVRLPDRGAKRRRSTLIPLITWTLAREALSKLRSSPLQQVLCQDYIDRVPEQPHPPLLSLILLFSHTP